MSDFELYDFMFNRDDEDSLRNTLFASSAQSVQTPVIKQESPDDVIKAVADMEADDLWKSFLESDLTIKESKESEFDSIRDLVGLPFEDVMDKFDSEHMEEIVDSAASDSGVSTDAGVDNNFSPGEHREEYSVSPDNSGFASSDTLDAESDISSVSDQGFSPSRAESRIPSYQFELISKDNKPQPLLESTKFKLEVNSIPTSLSQPVKLPQVTKLRLDLPSGGTTGTGSSSPTPVATTSVPGGLSAGAKTIFVTHPNAKGSTNLLKNGSTLLKTVNGRPILLPVVKDISQVKTIKIISTGPNNTLAGKNNVRTLVSAIQNHGNQSPTTTGVRTLFTTAKTADGRALLKVTPTAMVTPHNITIKEECINSDDETHQNGQELILTDEEKRLLKKEAIVLPPHYPLTKQEERDLKRIRRKIRNKISAQDSRKRKKEYVDGLEDRVKNCTEENHQLQKRIRHLESQNETLVVQLKRFQNILGTSVNSRNQGHASTALMMLILSAALFVVPSLRSQQSASDNEVSRSSKLPSAGHSRTLLEAKVSLGMNPLDSGEDDQSNDSDSSNPLSDHDYAPLAKKQKLMNSVYYPSMLDDFPPRLDKTMPDSSGDPPDGIGGLSDISALMGAFMDRLSNNWTDPGGSDLLVKTLKAMENKQNHSVVVNLARTGRIRDDIELE